MAREYFKAYHSYLESIEPLGDAERGRLFTALLTYSRTGIVPELQGNERFVFPTLKSNIEREIASYEENSAKNAINGSKGGRPQKTQKTQSVFSVFEKTQKRQDKEEDKDKNKESKEKVTCEQVVDLYRSICVSYPKVISLSEARKRAIRARLKMYSMDDFRMLFEKAEASSFLKGANNRNWSANFDWMIKDANMAKVIDGNYDDGSWNKHTVKQPSGNNTAKQLDDFYNMATEWAAQEDGDKDE